MKMEVFDLNGEKVKEVEVPSQFYSELPRKDLIQRAIIHEETKEKQPKGNYKWAGMETSARYIGSRDAYRAMKNRGISKLPREILPKGRFGRVRIVPHAVGGRRAHPPKVEKKIVEEMNKKEYIKALKCALSFVFNVLPKEGKKPFVVVDAFEDLDKTKKAVEFLKKVGVYQLVEDAKKRRERIKGMRRKKRAYKTPKRVLLIVRDKAKAFRNLPGVDVVKASNVKVKDIIPGGSGKRLVIFTESSIPELLKRLGA